MADDVVGESHVAQELAVRHELAHVAERIDGNVEHDVAASDLLPHTRTEHLPLALDELVVVHPTPASD